MHWSYWDVRRMPVPVVNAALQFCNEHVVGKGGGTLDDWD